MARDKDRYRPDSEEDASYDRFDGGDEMADATGNGESELEISPDEPSGEEPQFLRAQKRVTVRKGAVTKKTANRLRRVLIVSAVLGFLLITAFGLAYYATHSWRFRIGSGDDIETAGLENVSRAQIMEILGADIGRNIFKVPLEDRKRQLEDIPWVESATVMRLLPHHLRVQVKERAPAAFVRIGSKAALIDSSGTVMELPRKSKSQYSFPVITGMQSSDPLSTRAARMNIFDRLMRDLDSTGANYSKDLSEVDLADPDDIKITVEDPNGALIVHLGPGDFLERYKIYIAHVREWRQQFSKLESVDLRYNGQIVVNPDARAETNPAERKKP